MNFFNDQIHNLLLPDLSELGHVFGVKRRGTKNSDARPLRFGDQCVTKAVCRTASFLLNCCHRWAEGTNWLGDRRGRKSLRSSSKELAPATNADTVLSSENFALPLNLHT